MRSTSILSWHRVMGVFCLSLALMCISAGAEDVQKFLNVCKTGTAEQVTALLKAGADVNTTANRLGTGVTPLMYAAQYNPNPDVIAALLKAGADLNAKDMRGVTPLIYAVQYNQKPDVIAALVKAGADVNAKYMGDVTPLMYAAQYNPNPDVIVALLNAGADVNAKKNWHNATPLMCAARDNPNPNVIAVLLKAGANLDAKDQYDVTPLMYAAQYNQKPDMIAALLKAGADVNAKDVWKKTPLIYAADNRNPDVIAALLKAGADFDAKDNNGKTALDYARSARNSWAVTALIKAKTDPKALGESSKTPPNTDPAVKEQPETAKKSEEATAALVAAQKLKADKKDELAYPRFLEIMVQFPTTPEAATAAEEVAGYEGDAAFMKKYKTDAVAAKAKAVLSLAKGYRAAGRKDLAQKKYQEVVSQFPGTDWADQAQKQLEEMAR